MPPPATRLTDYHDYKLDDVILQMSERDYQNGCDSYLYHRVYAIDELAEFGNTAHILGSGGNPEVFEDELYITIPYDVYEFSVETYYANLSIYRYDLLYRNYTFDINDFEKMPGCVDDKENHTITVKTNKLRGRYIIGF